MPNTQPQAQSQTHSHKDTCTAHNRSTQPQHTTTINHNTQPEDPQTKSRTTKLTTMATCSSPWHEDK